MARNLRRLKSPPLKPRTAQSAPPRISRIAKRSIRERRRHAFRKFADRAVIGRWSEILLYLKKSRTRRANEGRESGSDFMRGTPEDYFASLRTRLCFTL